MSESKNAVNLHNRILRSRKKGAPTLPISMDGSGEHYAKWNKPGGKRQIPYDLTYEWNLINNTTSKQSITTDMEIKDKLTVTRGDVGRITGERRGRVIKGMYTVPIDNDWRKKWMWEMGADRAGESNGVGGNGDICNWTTIKTKPGGK